MSQILYVDGALSLTERIAKGNYGLVDPDITAENFPDDETTHGEWEWKLFHLEASGSRDAVIKRMADRGWNPGKPNHLIAFGEQYPKEQHKYPVLTLSSSDEMLLFLWDLPTGERYIVRDRHEGVWGFGFRFLAVRRIQNLAA